MNQVQFNQIESIEQINTLCVIADEIWREHYIPIIGKEQVDYMLDKFQSPEAITEQINKGYLYYFFAINEENIGYTGVNSEESALFLSKFYLLKEHRGKGYAHQVINYLCDFCRQKGLEKIYLMVNRHNSSTISAYEKLGFVKIREQKVALEAGFVVDDFVMEKQVNRID